MYRSFCLNSSTFAVSKVTSRRWWCIESLFPLILLIIVILVIMIIVIVTVVKLIVVIVISEFDIQNSSKEGAVETGCSGLHDVIGCFTM